MHSAMQTYSGSGPEPVANHNRRSQSFQPRSDNIEIPTFLRQSSPVASLGSEEGMKGGMYTQLSQTDSECSSIKNRSDYSLGSVGLNHMGSVGLNHNLNSNVNNNNNLFSENNGLPPTRRRTIGNIAKPSLSPKSKPIRLRSDTSAPVIKRYMPVKTSDGPGPSSVMQKSATLPRSFSSDELGADAVPSEGKSNLQRKKSSSMELLDNESTGAAPVHRNTHHSRTSGKPPVAGKRRPPLHHRYSSPILDTSNTSQKLDDSFWFEYGCV